MVTSLNQPQFIVLGGHKCGTSSLQYYLGQHPEIYMPSIKGRDLLSRTRLGIEDYQGLYAGMTTEKIAGEVSSVYLYSEKACGMIKQYLPEIKLFVILRNPVDRAISHFNTLPENEKRSLKEIFREKHVLDLGFYSNYLKLYFNQFNSEQIKVLLFDALVKNQSEFFSTFFNIVGVESTFMPNTSVIVRKGGKIKNKKLEQFIESKGLLRTAVGKILRPVTTSEQRRFISKKVRNLLLEKELTPEEIEKELALLYREDILKTQDFLNLDLSHWLKTN